MATQQMLVVSVTNLAFFSFVMVVTVCITHAVTVRWFARFLLVNGIADNVPPGNDFSPPHRKLLLRQDSNPWTKNQAEFAVDYDFSFFLPSTRQTSAQTVQVQHLPPAIQDSIHKRPKKA